MHINRRELITSILLALAAVAFVYHPIVFGGRSLSVVPLFPSVFVGGIAGEGATFDSLNGYEPPIPLTVTDPVGGIICDEPSPYVANRLLAGGNLPWLNVWQGLGHPLAANLMSAVFYPLQAIPILFPSALSWDIFLLLRVLLFGWFLYLFVRKLGLSKFAAGFGSFATAANGYVVEWVNMFHINVDLIAPLLLYLTEGYLQSRQRKWLAGIAVAVAVGVLGGNPQPLLLMLPMTILYAVVRELLPPGDLPPVKQVENRRYLWVTGQVALLGVIIGWGIALSGFLFLPFYELYRESFHTHPKGTSNLYPASGLRLFSIFPALRVNEWANAIMEKSGEKGTMHHSLWGPGLVAAPYLLMSVFYARRTIAAWLPFALVCGLFLIKNLGFAFWGLLEKLPIFSGLLFSKYTGVAIIAQGVLIALGSEWLVRNLPTRRLAWRALAIGAAILFAGAALVWLSRWLPVHLPIAVGRPFENRIAPIVRFYHLLAIALVVSMIVACACRKIPMRIAYLTLLLPLLAEGILNTWRPYPKRTEPYKEPEFIQFLKARDAAEDEFRTWSIGPILYPNTASAFGVEDFRHFDALIWYPWYNFVKYLVTGTKTGLLYDHFLGSRWVETVTNPFMDLCNVKYIVSDSSLISGPLLKRLAEMGKLTNHPGTPPGYTFTQAGAHPRPALYFSAPDVFKIPVRIDSRDEEFRAFLAFENYCGTPRRWGDGGEIRVRVNDGASSELVFEKTFDPENIPDDRRWFGLSIPLGKYVGKNVLLEFEADTGPLGDKTCDMVLLANATIRSVDEAYPQFPLVHQSELSVFRNPDALPRGYTASSMRLVNSWDEMQMVSKGAPESLRDTPLFFKSPETEAALKVISEAGKPPTSATATLVDAKPYRRSYNVAGSSPSILVVSNLAYPGWRVRVDEKSAPLLKAFGCLQAVVVPAGEHKVELEYAPLSVRIGGLISLLAGLGLIFFVWGEKFIPVAQRLAQRGRLSGSHPNN